jgi:hypothetical protein
MLLELILAAALSQPKAVMTMPVYDTSGSFSRAAQSKLISQIESHYLTHMAEVGTEDELYRTPVAGAKLLVIGGHGTPTSIALGGPDDPCGVDCDEKRYIDRSDVEELRSFFNQLAPDATILLNSCSTAWNGEENNIAAVIKRAAGDRQVIAAGDWVPADWVRITSYEPFDAVIYTWDLIGKTPRDVTVRY